MLSALPLVHCVTPVVPAVSVTTSPNARIPTVDGSATWPPGATSIRPFTCRLPTVTLSTLPLFTVRLFTVTAAPVVGWKLAELMITSDAVVGTPALQLPAVAHAVEKVPTHVVAFSQLL